MDKLLSYTLLRLLQLVVWLLDTVLGLLLGRTITGAGGGDTREYSSSGHLVDVVCRAKPTTMTTRLDHFLYTHNRYRGFEAGTLIVTPGMCTLAMFWSTST